MSIKDQKEVKHPRAMNKANRSRHEKEMDQIKWLKIGGIAVIALIVITLIVGAIIEFVYKPNKTLATVQDEKVNVTEFQEAVRYQRVNLISNYNYMAQLYQSFGMQMDKATRNNYESQLSEAYAPILGQQVYTTMVNQLVLDYGAKDAGISVSDDEVANEMENMWGYFPNGTPTPQPTTEPLASTPTISAEQIKMLNYTETPTPTATIAVEDISSLDSSGPAESQPAVEEIPTIEPTIISTEAESVEPTATQDMSPTPSLTPTTYTEEMYKKNVDMQFEGNNYYSKEFFVRQIHYQLLQQKVEDSLSQDIQAESDMVWARHILVATEEEAKAVIERLDKGEDWNVIAAEVSTDTSNSANGGDLGWFIKGAMVAPFEEAAFAQEIGTYTKEPVKSDFGYHIIQIIGHEERPLTSTQKQTALNAAYNDWLEAARAKLNVKTDTDWMEFVPTDPQFNAF